MVREEGEEERSIGGGGAVRWRQERDGRRVDC